MLDEANTIFMTKLLKPVDLLSIFIQKHFLNNGAWGDLYHRNDEGEIISVNHYPFLLWSILVRCQQNLTSISILIKHYGEDVSKFVNQPIGLIFRNILTDSFIIQLLQHQYSHDPSQKNMEAVSKVYFSLDIERLVTEVKTLNDESLVRKEWAQKQIDFLKTNKYTTDLITFQNLFNYELPYINQLQDAYKGNPGKSPLKDIKSNTTNIFKILLRIHDESIKKQTINPDRIRWLKPLVGNMMHAWSNLSKFEHLTPISLPILTDRKPTETFYLISLLSISYSLVIISDMRDNSLAKDEFEECIGIALDQLNIS